jgi:phytanoyl-CoA hydroxylase
MSPGLLKSEHVHFDHFNMLKPISQPKTNDIYGSYRPADPQSLNLESNFGPMGAESISYLQPTTLDTPLEVMRERFQRDGYLFV